MKYLKRAAALVLAMILSVMAFAGCEIQMENNDADTVAAVFEDEKIYMNETKLYIYLSQRQMEYSSQFMILYYYGGYDAFWESNWGYNLTQAMQEIYQTKLMARLAKDEGLTLTESEKEELARQTEKMKTEAETAKAIEYAGATDEIVDRFMEENALATKYYLKMMEDVDRTFDQETFRRKKLTGVSITAKSEKTEPTEEEPETEPESEEEPETDAETEEETEPAENEEAEDTGAESEAATEVNGPADEAAEEAEDEDGEMNLLGAAADGEADADAPEEEVEGEPETETYSDEEKSSNLKAAYEKILDLMKNGKAASEIVTEFANDVTVNVSTLSTVEVSPEDAKPEEDEEFTDYKQLGWTMATGDTEGRIITNSSGTDVGYVLYCENDDDPDYRKSAEDEELENRKKTLFAEKIAELQKKHSTFHVYQEKVANVKYKSSILGSITVTGDDFATLDESEDETGDTNAE